MATTLPDPETFGEPKPKPSDRIDSDEYHSLFDFEEE
jgi:hypothetical protein